MHEDLLVLQIPKFKVNFAKDKLYGYSSEEKRRNLKEQLAKASNGYCMYCYRRIVIDRQNNGHLEHSIEKDNSDKLIDCVSNISITCTLCNTSRKKRGEKQRKLSEGYIKEFEEDKCKERCLKPCGAYEKLKDEYIKNQDSQIYFTAFGCKR